MKTFQRARHCSRLVLWCRRQIFKGNAKAMTAPVPGSGRNTTPLTANETEQNDYVDSSELPGSELARRGLLLATLAATGMLLAWLASGLLSQAGLAGLDHALMQALHDEIYPSDPIGPEWLENALRDISALGSNIIVVLATVTAATLLVMRNRQGPAVLLLVTVAAAFMLNWALKGMFDRERPDFLSYSVSVESSSFPSSHAMLGAVLYLLIAAIVTREYASRQWGVLVMSIGIFIAFAIGFSRIYLGAHWPSDVLAGWALGAACALAAWQLARTPQPPEP